MTVHTRVSCPLAQSDMLQHDVHGTMPTFAFVNKPDTRITYSSPADAARRAQSSRDCSTSCTAPDRGSSGWRVVSREGPPLITGCALQRRPNPMGMSRLADRERYQHGNGPTLVAQLDPDAALAEGRAALELSQTTFVAETSLPTKYGRFRVRAYRHSVRLRLVAASVLMVARSPYQVAVPTSVRMLDGLYRYTADQKRQGDVFRKLWPSHRVLRAGPESQGARSVPRTSIAVLTSRR